MQRTHRWVFALGLVAGCFSDSTSGSGGTGDAGCPDGSSECPCYSNGTCDAGLMCQSELQLCFSATCILGAQDCPCDAGACETGLVCDAQVCQLPGGTSETAGMDDTADNRPDTGGEGTVGGDADTTEDDGAQTTVGDAEDTSATDTGSGCGNAEDNRLLLFASGSLRPSLAFPAPDVRAVVDDLCQVRPPAACSGEAHAVFSTDVDHPVTAMAADLCLPFDRPLVDENDEVYAESFNAALATGLAASLLPLFTSAESNLYWTSSTENGDYADDNCNDWGVGGAVTSEFVGAVGSAADMQTWLSSGTTACASPRPLLCVCASTAF